MVCCYFRIVYTVEPEHMLGLFLLEHIGVPLQTCSWQFIYTYSGKNAPRIPNVLGLSILVVKIGWVELCLCNYDNFIFEFEFDLFKRLT